MSVNISGVLIKDAYSMDFDVLFGILGFIGGFCVDFFTPACTYFRRKELGRGFA